ncbi:MAG: hypothetical protein K0Q50_728 [Vampirovibrio sp.]|jgi:hypothetical protein|nr:hypothetical protein [Vampirovibrio sp.]
MYYLIDSKTLATTKYNEIEAAKQGLKDLAEPRGYEINEDGLSCLTHYRDSEEGPYILNEQEYQEMLAEIED